MIWQNVLCKWGSMFLQNVCTSLPESMCYIPDHNLNFSAFKVNHIHYSMKVVIVLVTSKWNTLMFLVLFKINLCAKYHLRLRVHVCINVNVQTHACACAQNHVHLHICMHMPKEAHVHSYMVLSVFPAISWRSGVKVMHHMWFFKCSDLKWFTILSNGDCNNSIMDKLN